MAPRTVSLGDLPLLTGERLGSSDWHPVSQERITLFAEATGDRQWIHVDPERAAAGPFGTTIAHGFLTLSLASGLLSEIIAVEGCAAVVNYGLNRVRFPAPVPTGSRIRLHAALQSADVKLDGTTDAVLRLELEVAGEAKPCCVAELVFRYVPLGSGHVA